VGVKTMGKSSTDTIILHGDLENATTFSARGGGLKDFTSANVEGMGSLPGIG